MKTVFFLIISLCATQVSLAQQHHRIEQQTNTKGLRIAAIIGHTFINSDGIDGNLYIPSWGLDLDYWFNHQWGIGLHNDVEIENFVVTKNNNETIERVNPLVLTLDGLYHLDNGIVISLGPGVELEKNESFFLARVGIEYEFDIANGFYVMPTLFYDQRFDGFSTTTFGLGIGHAF
ncbi:hypothetical protein [Nonlabens agnitus]|uniref:Outer membrane protein beta-barrel domain-containing protein n=1 Tax=Nonlabens agnitus TaxID=870484 RepID=A0A2S9WR28_9FLAO|nr:hypothetical protein [Nonlabens agnitus]PRP65919.1 hypothetical protein BST86_01855 [Nonlabens agnitus]